MSVASPVQEQALWFLDELVRLRVRGEDTGGSLAVTEFLVPRGPASPLHVQPHEEETFYVLEGEALLHLDGSERSLSAGGFVSVPAGVPHAYLVTSEVTRTLILVTPGDGEMEAFFREAGEPAAERELPVEAPLDIERIAAAAERTGAVRILGPPPFG